MNIPSVLSFDASTALHASSDRVETAVDQNSLDISVKERTSVLPWRGQFSPQLVEYFLKLHVRPGQHVLDPFCGSGTVLFEGAREGVDVTGFDVNPAAVCLAKLSHVCALDQRARLNSIEQLEVFTSAIASYADRLERHLQPTEAVEFMLDQSATDENSDLLSIFLLHAFGNGKGIDSKKAMRSSDALRKAIVAAPFYEGGLHVETGDARSTGLKAGSVDYVITSPPYVNVFNYHQNYRPIIEALGFIPLAAARSEIGANRKFRQNRYITVVQYCMDIAQFFSEIGRVLTSQGRVTIILGRESNVRAVPFKNGQLVAAIASEGLSFEIESWNERSFVNRFGEKIFEDVLTLNAKNFHQTDAVEIGRAVGVQALRNALDYCPVERSEEIGAAIEFAPNVNVSPII